MPPFANETSLVAIPVPLPYNSVRDRLVTGITLAPNRLDLAWHLSDPNSTGGA